MEDNWYEAAVSAVSPHRIVSVVDWASDSPMPFAPIPHTDNEPATYNVFKWGVNDPSIADRSIEKESYDLIASPMGWHSLAVANDPYSTDGRRRGQSSWRNTSTTRGNNVGFSLFLSTYFLLTSSHCDRFLLKRIGKDRTAG
jgi:extracellular elastinolytic metalloproteinase